jgi:phosphopantothenoylcysteine decarboxylase/phosphopantothenate--cysteine ligase
MTLELVPTIDILASLAHDPITEDVLMVGFAAETDDLPASAVRKLADKRLDLIVLNDVSRTDIGMGSDDNEVTIFDSSGAAAEISIRSKAAVAAAILDVVESRLPPGRR